MFFVYFFFLLSFFLFFFFFNDTATTEIYTLSLHDALPIGPVRWSPSTPTIAGPMMPPGTDRKSTRLNSSHSSNSYAVFCLKKKKHTIITLLYLYRNRACVLSLVAIYLC